VRVILDTDPSMGSPGSEIDDGFALALLVADEAFQLELVTSVNGNTDVESATYLSMELLERLGRADIPVVRGAAAPLVEPDKARAAPPPVTPPPRSPGASWRRLARSPWWRSAR
jgi:purine nucleosidase